MRVPPEKPRHVPLWQLAALGVVRGVQGLVFPLRRMWRSRDPLDTYGLCHMTSVAGDALLAIALADSIFFSLPVNEAKLKVAAYLFLTMLPLALAGPLLVPLLDRAGPRRAIIFGAAAGRAAVALYAAPRFGTLLLFPSALIILVLSKVHAITKNGLTTAYASQQEGLMRANARLGRIAVAGAVVAAPLGYVFLKIWGSAGPLYLAAIAYAGSALLTLRLPHPGPKGWRRARWARAGGSRPSPCRRSARWGCARRAASCCSCWRSRSWRAAPDVLVRGPGLRRRCRAASSPTCSRRACPPRPARRRW